MKDWNLKRIDGLGRIVTGKTPSCDHPDEFGQEYPFITPSDIPNTQKRISVERFLSEKGMEEHKSIKLPPKTSCVVCIGATIGKTCMTHGISFSNQQINSIVPNKENNPDFVYYLASTLRDSLVSFAGGAATPIVNKSTFSSIKVLVPIKESQEKIAAILSTYDDLIEINNRRIAILEKMAEELYREWFVRLRFPGHEKIKIVKGMPEGWELNKIGDACKKLVDGDWIESKDQSESDYRLLQVSNIGVNKFIETNNYRYISEDTFRRLNCTEITEGDILVARMPEPTGRAWLVTKMPWKMVTAVDVAILKNDAKKINEHYIIQYLNSKYQLELVSTNSSGTTRERITRKVLSTLSILTPPIDLQDKYGKIVLPIFNQINLLISAKNSLNNSRDRLLSRLMSGKIDVENMDIQSPASMQEELVHA